MNYPPAIFQRIFLLTMLRTCDMMIVRQYDYMNYDYNHECCLSCYDLSNCSTLDRMEGWMNGTFYET